MSPVRLNDDTTGIRNVHAANWPARLAEKSVVWMTSGRQSRNSRRNRHAAHGHVRPAWRPDIPRLTTGMPARSSRGCSSSRA